MSEDKDRIPDIVNITLSESNNPKIQFTDPFPKSGEGLKVIWDEAGVMPVSSEYTHYWDVIKRPASSE